ncbi:hypothetical protein [Anaerococcus urinomassiliensis]|uniref:hypothetical protein n=1 Tax=Anaerococcus urinomassiliensis TaxID=1745712 RepID=UPI0009391AE8|nr:hypothetical protein [Anaerococcus urinomassiliensis]
MSQDINYYLRDLVDNSKINKLLADDETDISLILDLYTADYKGSRIKFHYKDQEVTIDTEDRKILSYCGKKVTENLDVITALSLDYEILRLFNIYKLDEDHFEELGENFQAEIKNEYNHESKKLEDYLIEYLKDIKENDYDEKLIGSLINKSIFNKKDDHFVLSRGINGSTIKYNSSKNKFTIKNNYSFKEKFKTDEIIKDFDVAKFNQVAESISQRKIYEKKRIELEDGISEYIGFNPGSIIFSDLDFDN